MWYNLVNNTETSTIEEYNIMRKKTTIEIFEEARERKALTVTLKNIVQVSRPRLVKLLKQTHESAYLLASDERKGNKLTGGLKLLLVANNGNLHIIEDWPMTRASAVSEEQKEMFREIVLPPNCTTAFRIALHLFTADEAEEVAIGSGTNIDFTTKSTKHAGGRPRKYGPESAQDVLERRANGESIRSIAKSLQMSTRTVQQLAKSGDSV